MNMKLWNSAVKFRLLGFLDKLGKYTYEFAKENKVQLRHVFICPIIFMNILAIICLFLIIQGRSYGDIHGTFEYSRNGPL